MAMTANTSRKAMRQVRNTGQHHSGCSVRPAYSQKPRECDRFIHLPGTAQLDQELVPLIKAVHQDTSSSDSGAFVIEFYDSAGAALYQERTLLDLPSHELQSSHIQPPPGLEAPPGLDAPSSHRGCGTITTLPAPISERVGHQVVLTGLPNKICSVATMEVVLEQAGLEDALVGDIIVTRGVHVGEVRVFLCSMHAAETCRSHFSGSRWSTTVDAYIAKDATSKSAMTMLSSDAPVFCPDGVSQLSVAAPDFVPLACCLSRSFSKSTSDTSTIAATDSEEESSDETQCL